MTATYPELRFGESVRTTKHYQESYPKLTVVYINFKCYDTGKRRSFLEHNMTKQTGTAIPPLLFNISSEHPLYQQNFLEAQKLYCIIPGKPIPLQRPRYSRGHVYDSQKIEKSTARIYIANAQGNAPLLSGAVQLVAEYYFEAPKNSQKLIGTYHTSPPDLDNCIKMTNDCLQGIAIANDCTVAQIFATKLWAHTSGTRFTLKQLKGNNGK